jgi:ABC-type multidrug transport system permease subunit
VSYQFSSVYLQRKIYKGTVHRVDLVFLSYYYQLVFHFFALHLFFITHLYGSGRQRGKNSIFYSL